MLGLNDIVEKRFSICQKYFTKNFTNFLNIFYMALFGKINKQNKTNHLF